MYKGTNLVINALKQKNKTEEENKNVKKTTGKIYVVAL